MKRTAMKKSKGKEAKGAGRKAGRSHATAPEENTTYILRLYITGTTPRAKAAVMKVKSFCEENLKGHYELEIIDIYQQPTYAREEQIIAAPTLVRKLPEPLRRLVGDFSQTDRVRLALDIKEPVGT